MGGFFAFFSDTEKRGKGAKLWICPCLVGRGGDLRTTPGGLFFYPKFFNKIPSLGGFFFAGGFGKKTRGKVKIFKKTFLLEHFSFSGVFFVPPAKIRFLFQRTPWSHGNKSAQGIIGVRRSSFNWGKKRRGRGPRGGLGLLGAFGRFAAP